MTFDELAAERKRLQLFCYQHAPSLELFRCEQNYKLDLDEPVFTGFRHLTSTATCIESLLLCPPKFRAAKIAPESQAQIFASSAIALPDRRWKSDQSAAIYCRCRGLPLTIRYLDSYDREIDGHIARILGQLEESNRFAIGEADPRDKDLDKRDWYPPNAYHTYWTFEVLQCFEEKFSDEFVKFNTANHVAEIRNGMLLWVRRTLAHQVSLHAAKSSVLDSDQLAWALASVLKFAKDFPAQLEDQDLLRESLKQLFSTQLEVGTWRHYKPLFHYKKTGNAYCYVYETFAALLGIAVDQTGDRKFFRDCLSLYQDNLRRLWEYADSTKVHLSDEPDEPRSLGWSSGHRLNRSIPESWATASVFAFAQGYRRLLGIWTREAAATELNVVKPRFDKTPEELLQERGDSWILPPEGEPGVLELLYTLYIYPFLAKAVVSQDADNEIVDKNQARSA